MVQDIQIGNISYKILHTVSLCYFIANINPVLCPALLLSVQASTSHELSRAQFPINREGRSHFPGSLRRANLVTGNLALD